MPNNYEPISDIYNSFFSYRLGKQMNKDNPKDKYKIGNLELSKSGTLLGGVSLLGSLASWNENRQRQNIVNEVRQDSYDNNYINTPTDKYGYNSGIQDMFNNSSFKDGGQIPDRYKEMGFTRVDTPKRTPNAAKSHAVVIKDDGDYRLIRFGQQGVSGSPKKEGESDSDRKRRESFKARHAETIAKGKTSAAYWSNREKWSSGGTIDDVSLQGYRTDSPYKNEPYLDIDSNVISMLGVSKPLIAYPDNDEPVLMQPNQEYYFPNSTKVREIPVYQNGGYITKPTKEILDQSKIPTFGDDFLVTAGKLKDIVKSGSGSVLTTAGKILKPITSAAYFHDKNYLKSGTNFVPFLNEGLDYFMPGWDSTQANQGIENAFSSIPKAVDVYKDKVKSIFKFESGGININPKNKGVFTAKAKSHGLSVQTFARYVMSHKEDFPTETIKQANFAINSTKFKHQDGGEQPSEEYEDWQIGYEQQTPQQANSIEDYMRDNPDDYDIYETYGQLFADSPEVIVDPEIQYWEMQQQEYNQQEESNRQQVQSGTTIAERHRTLGNMKFSPWMEKYGASPGEIAPEGDGTRFAKFNSFEDSKQVHKALLMGKGYRNLSVKDAMDRYAAKTYDRNLYKELSPIINKKVSDLSDNELNFLMKTQTKFEDKNVFNKYYGK